MSSVHHVYMAKKGKKSDKPLRWRANCIGAWREFRNFTQDEAVEALDADPLLNPKDKVTRNSLSRIENGKQMPGMGTIEALARLYRTDLDSLLNRAPVAADAELPQTAAGIVHLWDKASAHGRGLIFDLAKRIVKTDG